MTGWLLFAAVLGAADWVAVSTEKPAIERVFKPLVMFALIGAAVSSDGGQVGAWIVGGLVLSLAGDVFLMLPKQQFLAGLGSFLLAHVSYSIGFFLAFESSLWALGSLVLLVPSVMFIARPIVRRVAEAESASLTRAVGAYMVAISVMIAFGFATGVLLVVLGAVLFFASDAVLGWNKFVEPIRNGRVILMVCYHSGQALIVAAIPLLG